ncbi:MAG: hypothetical protein V3V08_21230 [Nannocystaceae bacterium]
MNETERAACAYFDDELESVQREQFEARLRNDAGLRDQMAAWSSIRELVVGEAEAATSDLADARFEQIWDQVEASLDRPSDARIPSPVSRGLGARLKWLWPALAATAATAVVLFWWSGEGNGPDSEVQVARATDTAPSIAGDPTSPRLDGGFGAPVSNDLQIDRIEFAGRVGQIAKIPGAKGTTTVIWVQEEPQPFDSERSL